MQNVIVSRKNRALVIPRDGQTENMFPSAPSLDDGRLVVPHDVRETVMLRHLGYKVPNPGLCYYDFGTMKPFSVQKRTFDLMTTTARSYVFNEMGTGKTLAILPKTTFTARTVSSPRLTISINGTKLCTRSVWSATRHFKWHLRRGAQTMAERSKPTY